MNCPYNHDEPESRLEWFEENFEKLLDERDELYWKTQEDEREINELRDINKELRDKIKKLEVS